MCITLLGRPAENLSRTAQPTDAPGRIHAIVKHVGTSAAAATWIFADAHAATLQLTDTCHLDVRHSI